LNEGLELKPSAVVGCHIDINGGGLNDKSTGAVDQVAPFMPNVEWILLATMIDRIACIVYGVMNGIMLVLYLF
jgi:hypothetical protein